jgi:hypothetical protein
LLGIDNNFKLKLKMATVLTSIHGDRIGLSSNDDLVINGQIAIPAVGSKIVNLTASTLTITRDAHSERVITVNRAAGSTITLPAATGTGSTYKFFVGTTITSVGLIIKAASASDSFLGLALGADNDGEGATGYTWKTDAGDDTITLNGTSTGGYAGDFIEIIDVASGIFSIQAKIKQSGGSEATPFSATVS